MNQSQNTQLSSALMALIEAGQEAEAKVTKALTEAKKARDAKIASNQTKRALAARLINEIRDNLKNTLEDEDQAAKDAYKKCLVDNGLSAEVFPMETMATAIDTKAITPVLKSVGKVGGFFSNLGKGITERVSKGYKEVTA